ncbi:MAG: hypothetical protein ACLQIJ_04465 [Polyangia bacterium]
MTSLFLRQIADWIDTRRPMDLAWPERCEPRQCGGCGGCGGPLTGRELGEQAPAGLGNLLADADVRETIDTVVIQGTHGRIP